MAFFLTGPFSIFRSGAGIPGLAMKMERNTLRGYSACFEELSVLLTNLYVSDH